MTDIEFLTWLKMRLGIIYTDPLKDAEIQGMIDEAKDYLLAAGWSAELNTPAALGAVTIYVKQAQQSDPTAMEHNPVLLSLIAQNRW